ncbi:hypothetical protein [Spirosoma sp. KNUC1025]|uniref:hypothetical protein n=1 Tax=Spirosoma sp. KNUC1025 TaxID=2894082 RepID=UPI003863103D|nr:hypothetical protein LN737_20905 [Spirosoma sp. KNUC1025]
MTLFKRLFTFFAHDSSSPIPVTSPTASAPVAANTVVPKPFEGELFFAPEPVPFPPATALPDWLIDDEFLRDEGVLFGLSDTQADGKIAEIRAVFAQQSAPFEAFVDQQSEKIGELNLLIEQRENQLTTLRNRANDLRTSQATPTNLIRTIASLCLSVALCIGTFFLVDVTLQPAFPNQWISVGVFLAGMFNLFGRFSVFYDSETRLSGRRIIEEVGLPLASSVFVFVHALQTQSVATATGLFLFIFFVFLLSGKLFLSLLATLQAELRTIASNRTLIASQVQKLPVWESEIGQLEQEVDAIRIQKWPVVVAMNQAEAERNQLNAQRDRLVNLFLSEFELARSLRDRLTDKQREAFFN